MHKDQRVAKTWVRRRTFLGGAVASIACSTLGASIRIAAAKAAKTNKATEFQLACMTLPYAAFPLRRALRGIRSAGYRYVAWGTSHQETPGGARIPVMPVDAAPAKARALGNQCRAMGLQPLMMFSTVYPESEHGLAILTSRIRQAAAAGIPQVLTFGHTQGGNRKLWTERFKKLATIARDHGVMIVVKQHGGSTGTGKACADIIREVDDPAIRVNYDAGNVMDYLDVDPIPDIRASAPWVHSFCMKDHRNWPKDQDCAPGYGEIDHYRLLAPVAFLGRNMPLCCENIAAPVLPRPSQPEGIDRMARRVREFLETVIAGLQA